MAYSKVVSELERMESLDLYKLSNNEIREIKIYCDSLTLKMINAGWSSKIYLTEYKLYKRMYRMATMSSRAFLGFDVNGYVITPNTPKNLMISNN